MVKAIQRSIVMLAMTSVVWVSGCKSTTEQGPYPGVSLAALDEEEQAKFVELAKGEVSPCEGQAGVSLHEALVASGAEGRCGLAKRAAYYLMRTIKTKKMNDTDTLNALAEYIKALTTEYTFTIEGRPTKGPLGASVQVVEFADFQCGHCRQASGVLADVARKYEGKIAFTYKMYPMIKGSKMLSIASLAAHRQGKFWEMHDALYQGPPTKDEAALREIVGRLGLDVEQFEKDRADPELQKMVTADMDEGRKAKVEGTPTIFIDGKHYVEERTVADMSRVIDAALAEN